MGAHINREIYLENPEVKSFAKWLESKLDPPGSFMHQYYLVKAKRLWKCSSLYDAYENYWWPYRQYCCIQNKEISGSNFRQSFAYLSYLAEKFRFAVSTNDAKTTVECALEMLKWGGVSNRNRERILQMGEKNPAYFRWVRERLELDNITLGDNERIIINSGFTKLYFLLVDDFIMYDGRVGAALGLLGRLYTEEQKLAAIPPTIEFSFGSGKSSGYNQGLLNRRDPSSINYRLPEFTGRPERHLTDNIKASWLLKYLADKTKSRFSDLPQTPPLNERLTAIQSALFMIGYNVMNKKEAVMHFGISKPLKESDEKFYPLRTVSKGYPFRVDCEPLGESLRFSYPVKISGKRRAPDYFSLEEIMKVCEYLALEFAGEPFPLANNVVRLTDFTEKPGLGMAIRVLPDTDVLKAQASSYLGPYLAEVGVFKSVMSNQTMWRLDVAVDAVIPMIKEYHLKALR